MELTYLLFSKNKKKENCKNFRMELKEKNDNLFRD